MRILSVLATLSLLLTDAAACSSQPKLSNGETDAHMKVEAKLAVKDRLRDPGSAQFSALAVHDRGPGRVVVCGLVNSKNGFGGYAGDQPFMYRGGGATIADASTSADVQATFMTECVD